MVTSSMNEYSDEVMMEFGHQVTGGGEKWFSIYPEAPGLFMPVGENLYSLLFLGEISENPAIPVSFQSGHDGNYTLEATGMESFTNIFLHDLKTGASRNLKTTPFYNFTALITDDVNRFLLRFTSVGIDSREKEINEIYFYDNELCISNPCSLYHYLCHNIKYTDYDN